MKRFFYLIVSLALLIAGCSKEIVDLQDVESAGQQKELREVIITASIADASDQTRTAYNETELKNYWSPGDKIKVFSAGEAAEFTSLNTELEPIVKFKGNIASITGSSNDDEDSKDYVWGLYPYSEAATYAEPDGISRTARITTTYTDVQTGVAGTFGDNLAVMIGRSESLSIPFRGAYSGAFFQVSRDDIVSMTLRGLNGEVLAGKATIGLDGNLLPVVYDVTDEKTAVTVTAPNGTFETGKNYYIITLPDVALPNGYSVTLRRSDGYEGTYELRANRPLNRIKFRNLSEPVDVRIENAQNIANGVSTGWVQSTTLGINEIWYTTSDNSVIQYNTAYASETGNEVDDENCVTPSANNGVGIIRFYAPLTKIDKEAFSNKEKLTSVSWPETVETIGQGAFQQCRALSDIVIGPNVKVIEEDAFWETAIATLSLPEGIRRIDYCAFQNCPLTEVTIPNSVDSLGYSKSLSESASQPLFSNPFLDCAFLTTFHGRYASDDGKCLVDNGVVRSFATGGMEGATYEVPSNVRGIGLWSFCGSTISHIVLPNQLLVIYDYAFMSSRIEDVTIPASVSQIYTYAFYYCSRLNWIKIMKTSGVIGAKATWGSPAGMFNRTNDCPIYVPATLLNYYKGSQYWDVYESRYRALIEDNEIFYTTSDGEAVRYNDNPATGNELDGDIIAPKNNGGIGIIRFKSPITWIDDSAFMFAKSTLTSVTFPDCVETIGTAAFEDCTLLTNVTFGSGLKTINQWAFGNTGLGDVDFLPDGLENIGACAFEDCSNITRVTIPESVVHLGYYERVEIPMGNPFDGCLNIQSFSGKFATSDGRALIETFGGHDYLISYTDAGMVGQTYVVPENVWAISFFAFWHSKLANVVLPDNLARIYDGAFYYCTNLSSVTIPSGVELIGGISFSGCSALEWVKIEATSVPPTYLGNHYYETGMFAGSTCPIYVPATLLNEYKTNAYWKPYASRYQALIEDDEILYTTSDGAAVSYNVTSDTGNTLVQSGCKAPDANNGIGVIKFSAPVTEIDEQALYRSENLTSVILPDGVETIGAYSFTGCSSLGSVSFGSNVTAIESNAFDGCHLETVNLPGSLTFLGEDAFKANPLTTVAIPASLTTTVKNPFLDCSNLTSFTGNNSLVSSDGLALINSSGELISYALAATTGEYQVPDGVVTLGNRSMQGAKFTKVILPSTLETIGLGAFRYSDITEVTIPASVTTIDNVSFAGCTSLATIRIESETAPTLLGGNTFAYAPADMKIWVPGLSAAYYNNETSAQPNWYAMRNHIAYYQTDKEIWYHLEGDGTDQISLTSGTGANYTGSCIISPNNELSDIDPFVDVPETISAGKIMVLAYDNNLTMVPASAFTGYFETLDYVSLPNSVASVGSRAFEKCSKLVRMPFSENSAVWSINSYAFSQCTGLTGPVYLPKVSNLGSYVFNRCSNITEVTLGAATSIPVMGFASSGITRLNIAEPQNVTTVNRFAFYGASELTTIGTASAPEGRVMLINATNVGERAFGSAKVKRVYLGSVVNLGPYAFEGTSQLEFIDLNSLTRLQEYTFARSGIKALYLPAIETLDDMALGQAWNLTTLDLGSSLNSVGDFIFHDLHTTFVNTFEPDNLDIKFNGPLPATISSDAFFFNKDENSPLNGTLFDFKSVSVPSAALASYKQYFSSVGYTSTTIQNEVTGF